MSNKDMKKKMGSRHTDGVRRVFVEKKKGFQIEAEKLRKDLVANLGMQGLTQVRMLNRYDIEGVSEEIFNEAIHTIFSEKPVDHLYLEEVAFDKKDKVFAIAFLPGQYDIRKDFAEQCLQLLTPAEVIVKTATVIVLSGDISDADVAKIKQYHINPLESQEVPLDKPTTLVMEMPEPDDVASITGFIGMTEKQLTAYAAQAGFAMSMPDLLHCQTYFREEEKRDPSETELKMIDTYWSDHCRHTTFLTHIEDVKFADERYAHLHKAAYQDYLKSREYVYADGKQAKAISFMDIATIAAKELRKKGLLDDLDISEEVNACSIAVTVNVDGKDEDWLVMFKNETHNHPTEFEPFGGAATCLGGAIRDPLSGRSYVYQAMRVTGCGDPRKKVEETVPGKLPQRKITTTAATGYSSYGGQIGLATGQVTEIYDEKYITKRMELGAVIAAAPRKNVVREVPMPGDVVVLLGGRTGRDGCGGATGSSKEHDETSLERCGAEVQKGKAAIERNLQRLFRNGDVSRLIKRCNDFGAGGVSVAIGELADSLEIDLDRVPTKYAGLDGTELAISESQERMAVVIAKKDIEKFMKEAEIENLEATVVAEVTDSGRLRMKWRGTYIVDISRAFLNTNGVGQTMSVVIPNPMKKEKNADAELQQLLELDSIEKMWKQNLQRLNVCSQKGLVEMFGATAGGGTVLMPLGGEHQLTPQTCMVAKIPVLTGDTTTATAMSFGYNPTLSTYSPFHGAMYAVIESVAKLVAVGVNHSNIRLSLQEYFEKPGTDPEKWGAPLAALLGAHHAQKKLQLPAIGGKDSMSGTFKDMGVPPTLVSFAVGMIDARTVISSELKLAASSVVYLPLRKDEDGMPDFAYMHQLYKEIVGLIQSKHVVSASNVGTGGIAETISKMCFGNKMGFRFSLDNAISPEKLFAPQFGAMIVEVSQGVQIAEILKRKALDYELLGTTTNESKIVIDENTELELDALIDLWKEPLETIFPTKVDVSADVSFEKAPENFSYTAGMQKSNVVRTAAPKVFIPIFPGTNCEYESIRLFEKAGAKTDGFVFQNQNPAQIAESIREMAKRIADAQILMLPGGSSAADEPDGAGKFIVNVLRNPLLADAVMDLIKRRDGLVLGVCNGFQALIKLGLLPYGEIREIGADCPTLTYNTIGRAVSSVVNVKVCSDLSPWMSEVQVGEVYKTPIAHGQGRFVADEAMVNELAKNGQIAAQYVDGAGNATYDVQYNPSGSFMAVEGITDVTGRILGKMGHEELLGMNCDILKNVPGKKNMRIFEAGVRYFG